MRKKALFYALIASGLFVGCLASCNDKSTANTSSSVAETSSSTSTSVPQVEASSSTSTSNSQTQSYNLVDDEKSQKAYSELLKSFPDITYDDFLMNGTDSFGENEKTFRYMSSSVTISSNNTFVDKTITIKDSNGNDLTSTYSKYINNEWVKITDYKFFNNERKTIYSIWFKNDLFDLLEEYTYDDNGNKLTEIESKYINNEWIKIKEYKYYNNERKTIYYIDFNDDTFDDKWEYTYDESGNELTRKYSNYINDEWVVTGEYKWFSDTKKTIYEIWLSNEKTFTTKNEYTYDDDGNLLTKIDSKYLNNEWLKIREYKYINNKEKKIYELVLNDDDTFYYKVESTYDDNGNTLTFTIEYFDSINWKYNYKYEYTYDENGSMLTRKQSKYINNEWVKIEEYKYINNEEKTTYYTYFSNGSMYSLEEFTYDADGNKLTKTESKYIDNKWVKIREYKYINNQEKTTYSLVFLNDVPSAIFEYTYDENGNTLIETQSDYVNNEWVYELKYEYTYDAQGNKLTKKRFDYVNNDWLKTSESKYINNTEKSLYYITLKNDGSFDSKLEYKYDDNNVLSTQFKYTYANDDWAYENKYEYTFNDDLLESVVTSKYANNDWVKYSKKEYTYDTNGKILTEKRYRYIDNNWLKDLELKYINESAYEVYRMSIDENGKFETKFENTYDDNGNKLTARRSEYINNVWVKYIELIYINNESKVIYDLGLNSNREFVYLKEYTYDTNGNELTYKSSSYINNAWVKMEEYKWFNNERKTLYRINTIGGSFYDRYEYTYDTNGNETLFKVSDYKNNDWVYDIKVEYTYDTNDNKKSAISSKFINTNWVKIAEYTYINNEEKEIMRIKLNTDGTYDEKYEKEYDTLGFNTSTTYSQYESSNWVYKYRYEYLYDASGNEKTEIYENYKNGNFVYQYKYEYTYDAQGNKTSTSQYIFTNGDWEWVYTK